MRLRAVLEFFDALELTGAKRAIAEKIIGEIRNRLRFLTNVGSTISRSIARPRRCPAAKRSASGSRARSARA
jgi:hypothetical protein